MSEKKLTPEEFVDRELSMNTPKTGTPSEEEQEILDQMTPDKTWDEMRDLLNQIGGIPDKKD